MKKKKENLKLCMIYHCKECPRARKCEEEQKRYEKMLRIIISLILGYFIGMASCLLQVIRMENRENKKIGKILKNESK